MPSAPVSAARVAALALGVLALAGPAPAKDLKATFDLFLSGIKAGEMRITSEVSGSAYRAETDMETAGVLGAFANFFYEGTASGTLGTDSVVEPTSFAALSRSPRAERETRIEFENGTPVFVSVEPPRSSAPEPATQAGTLDPISAGFSLLRDAPVDQLCNRTVDVFDGSRRSRLTLGAPQPDDAGITCEGRFTRIEGEAHSMSDDAKEYPFRIVFRENGDGLAEFLRIESKTKFGKAVIERRS